MTLWSFIIFALLVGHCVYVWATYIDELAAHRAETIRRSRERSQNR